MKHFDSSLPTSLNPERISELLSTKYIGRKMYFFESTTSTFDAAADCDPDHGTLICARTQTKGSGRLGRSWHSEEGGVYFSIILRPDLEAERLQFLTAVCALGVQKALSEYLPCKIKWPNDIVSENGQKLCGILTKGQFLPMHAPCLNVGIGINVNNTDFDPELKYAGSLKTILGHSVDENEVLCKVLLEIERCLESDDEAEITRMYSEASATLGKKVKAMYANSDGIVTGTAIAIEPDGSLVIETDEGGRVCVNSGEVSVRGIYDDRYA